MIATPMGTRASHGAPLMSRRRERSSTTRDGIIELEGKENCLRGRSPSSYQRAPLDCALEFSLGGPGAPGERFAGCAKDISLGGMYIQTEAPLSFGASVVVFVLLPGQRSPCTMRGVVRWLRPREGMGVQFGLLGARETHAITELTKAP